MKSKAYQNLIDVAKEMANLVRLMSITTTPAVHAARVIRCAEYRSVLESAIQDSEADNA